MMKLWIVAPAHRASVTILFENFVGYRLGNPDSLLIHACGSLAERLGSGDGERKTLLTRQIAFEPLPASVLLNKAATRRGRLGACWGGEGCVSIYRRLYGGGFSRLRSYVQSSFLPSPVACSPSFRPNPCCCLRCFHGGSTSAAEGSLPRFCGSADAQREDVS